MTATATTTFGGRKVLWSKSFPANGTFQAFYDASGFLKELGYQVGSMCRNEPIGFADNDVYDYVAKWYNIDVSDRLKLDGVMISDDFREGGVEVLFMMTPKL
jgi:hypothetical protein